MLMRNIWIYCGIIIICLQSTSVRSEGYNSQFEAEHHPGSNLEYTITINDNSQSITSNGQMAVVTSVDTVRISGDVTNQAVTKFRYIDPSGVTINDVARLTKTKWLFSQ
jgi:hypothetical protein